MADTPNLDDAQFRAIDADRLLCPERATHAPRILLLYGSLRARSYSRLITEEAARILGRLGAETRTYRPSGLPLPDDAEALHPKVAELRDLVTWSEGMGLVLARAARRDDRDHEGAGRLDPRSRWAACARPKERRWP